MSRIYWDTMLFIYLFEDHKEFAPRVQAHLDRMMDHEDVLCTSVFAYGEVLTGFIKESETREKGQGEKEAGRRQATKDYFRGNDLELIPFTADVAERFAEIRAKHNVGVIDAIHLATAAQARVDLFLTNDFRLQRLRIPGISFIAGLDGKLL